MILQARLQFTGAGQTHSLIPLPDFPGWVVQVHRVKAQLEGWTSTTIAGILLAHNTGPGFTFTTTAPERAWTQLYIIPDGGPNSAEQVFDPVPYELAGHQRFVLINSAGTTTVRLSVLYSLRRERNKTLWNALRAKTSFSTG